MILLFTDLECTISEKKVFFSIQQNAYFELLPTKLLQLFQMMQKEL